MLMGHSISMFHQPKNLKFLLAGRKAHLELLLDNDNSAFADELRIAFNE